jgi:hypothetical protein
METENATGMAGQMALIAEQNARLQALVAELLRKNEELRRALVRPPETQPVRMSR